MLAKLAPTRPLKRDNETDHRAAHTLVMGLPESDIHERSCNKHDDSGCGTDSCNTGLVVLELRVGGIILLKDTEGSGES